MSKRWTLSFPCAISSERCTVQPNLQARSLTIPPECSLSSFIRGLLLGQVYRGVRGSTSGSAPVFRIILVSPLIEPLEGEKESVQFL